MKGASAPGLPRSFRLVHKGPPELKGAAYRALCALLGESALRGEPDGSVIYSGPLSDLSAPLREITGWQIAPGRLEWDAGVDRLAGALFYSGMALAVLMPLVFALLMLDAPSQGFWRGYVGFQLLMAPILMGLTQMMLPQRPRWSKALRIPWGRG